MTSDHAYTLTLMYNFLHAWHWVQRTYVTGCLELAFSCGHANQVLTQQCTYIQQGWWSWVGQYGHGLTNSEKEFLVYFICLLCHSKVQKNFPHFVKEACRGTPLAPPTHCGLMPTWPSHLKWAWPIQNCFRGLCTVEALIEDPPREGQP